MKEVDIKNLETNGKRYKQYLGNNLYVDVMKTGNKYYRYKCATKTITLGQSPMLSLKQARVLADDIRVQERKPKSEKVLFGTILNSWLESKEWKDNTRKSRMKVINKYLSELVKYPLDSIKRTDLVELLRKIEAQGAYSTTKRVLGIINEVLDFALISGYTEVNQASGIHRVLKKAKSTPRAALTKEDDVKRIMVALETVSNEVIKELLKFIAMTLCRPSECRFAKWEEIDGTNWVIPAERMKMGKEHVVPLSTQCLKILEKMKKYRVNEYIFPSPAKNQALSENILLITLRKLGFAKEEMSIHGFRSMGSTILNEQGYKPDIIEKALAHSGVDKIRSIYNRAEYFEERKAMLQDYSDYLERLVCSSD